MKFFGSLYLHAWRIEGFCVTFEHRRRTVYGATLRRDSVTLCILGWSRCQSVGCESRRSSESRFLLLFVLRGVPKFTDQMFKHCLAFEVEFVAHRVRWVSFSSDRTWLILPVAICLSQRLSHACLSISLHTAKLRMAH